MRKILTALSFFLLALGLAPGLAFASADRVALVVGISSYQFVPELKNPVNDLKVMRETLQRLGFDVVSSIDASKKEFETKIEEFRVKMRNSEVALFYFAGHGLQVNGKNYLIPRDASLPDLASIEKQSIEFDRVISLMEQMSRTNLVFLDACRNNPLSRNLSRAIGDGSTRSVIGTGLASVNVGKGTLVTYSTQPGNVAADGSGVNSPFTAALSRWMGEPGLEVRQMLSRVRKDVLSATYGQQVPWDHSSMTGDFYFVTSGKNAADAVQSQTDKAKEMWGFVSQSNDVAMFETFIKSFPASEYAPFAEAKIRSLKPSQVSSLVPAGSKVDLGKDRDAINEVVTDYLVKEGNQNFGNIQSGPYPPAMESLDTQIELLDATSVAVHFEATIHISYFGNTFLDGSGTLIVKKLFGNFSVVNLQSFKKG